MAKIIWICYGKHGSKHMFLLHLCTSAGLYYTQMGCKKHSPYKDFQKPKNYIKFQALAIFGGI